jgi:hypothetical protein
LAASALSPFASVDKQRGHVVDERARAARADAVHALLRRSAEISDLRILAAKLHDCIRLRDQLIHGRRAGDDLLHEWQADALWATAHARRAGEREGELLRPPTIFFSEAKLPRSAASISEK